MIEDYFAGRDAIFEQYQTVLPNTVDVIGERLVTVYQGVEPQDKIPTNKFWARVSLQTVLEGQAALRGNDLKTRYQTDGLVFVQVFSSKAKVENYAKGVRLAALIKKAFRGKQTEGCVWFRNVRIQELSPEDAWYRLNVVAEYQYDELG